MTASDASVAPPGSTTRILVVDDEDVIRDLTRRILEDHGYHVLTSRDGPAALDVARLAMMQPRHTVHLVLTDIDMPGMNGYALGRLLALTWPDLPIVYMSGTTVGLAGRESLGGAEHFITKPFSDGELLTTLRGALRVAALNGDSSQPRAITPDGPRGPRRGGRPRRGREMGSPSEMARARVGRSEGGGETVPEAGGVAQYRVPSRE